MKRVRQRPVVWYVAAGYDRAGGIEAYLHHYALEMRNQGFDPVLVVLKGLPAVPHRFLASLVTHGVPVRSVGDALGAWPRFVARALWPAWALGQRLRGRVPTRDTLDVAIHVRMAAGLLRRWLRRERPDVIHVKGRLFEEVWPVFPAERTIYHINVMGQRDPTWTDSEVAAFRAFAGSVARVLAPGRGVAEVFKREFEIDRAIDVVFTMAPDEEGEKEYGGEGVRGCGGVGVSECPTPISNLQSPITNPRSPIPSPGTSARAPIRFGILCRFSAEKGLPHILDALSAYRARHGAVTFTFAGEGELDALIRERVKREGWPEVRIERVSSAVETLRTLDVFVHPSTSEAMPVAIVEALMCGLPCITTPVGGIADLVRDGVEGLLVEPGSAEAILTAMERFATMAPAERESFAVRARARYEECCTPARVGAVVASIYRRVLEDARQKT